jgi:hypothetical protein
MVEKHLAQVILDALTQDPGQEDECEHRSSLHQDEPAVNGRDLQDALRIAAHDALVHDLLVQVREVRIQD